jgi:RimJ/RimL family protein N-acetyltransferase
VDHDQKDVMTAVFAQRLGDGAELAMLEPWHAEEFLATLDKARPALVDAIPAAREVHTVADARATLQKWADAHAQDTRHLFGIWVGGELPAPGASQRARASEERTLGAGIRDFVGVVQLFSFDAAMLTCEMGVWLAPWAQGRGLMTAACRSVLDWAIRVRGMRRVQWTNDPANAPSSAMARRLGMTREGVLRSSRKLGDDRWDNEIWSIIAEEWPTLPSEP